MRIINYKKKGISISIKLIIIGAVISLIGFGLLGFDINKFDKAGAHQWYSTVHVTDGNFSLGIDLDK